MNDIKHCIRCGGELEMIIEGFGVCKNCKRLHADHGGGDYDEIVCIDKIDETPRPVYWINNLPSLQAPQALVVFAYFTSRPSLERHYVAGPSVTAIQDLVRQVASQTEKDTLTIVDEAEVEKLKFMFFAAAKETVSKHQQTYYLGTDFRRSH